jgi:hypothetical protein
MSKTVYWQEYVAFVPNAWSKGGLIEEAVVGAALRRHKNATFEFVVHAVSGEREPQSDTPPRVWVDDMGSLRCPQGSDVRIVARGDVSVDKLYDDDSDGNEVSTTTIKITATEFLGREGDDE